MKSRSLGRGLDQVRSFYLEESPAIQKVTYLVSHPVTQHQRVAERIAPQIQKAVFHPQFVASVALILDRERRSQRSVQHVEAFEHHLDFAGRYLGVLGCPFDDAARRADHVFAAQMRGRFEQLGGRVLLDDQLRDAVPVAQVDEGHRAQVAHFLYPAGQRDGLIQVFHAEFSAGVCSVHRFVFHSLSFGARYTRSAPHARKRTSKVANLVEPESSRPFFFRTRMAEHTARTERPFGSCPLRNRTGTEESEYLARNR